MVELFDSVMVGDDVLIGDNICICRGSIDNTVLESGTKSDNLGHVYNNYVLKATIAMAFSCRLGGSAHFERNGFIAGAIIRNQCKVEEYAIVGMDAVFLKDVAYGETVVENPARPLIRKKE